MLYYTISYYTVAAVGIDGVRVAPALPEPPHAVLRAAADLLLLMYWLVGSVLFVYAMCSFTLPVYNNNVTTTNN